MIKKDRAQLMPMIQPKPIVPAKSADGDVSATMISLAHAVQKTAELVAASAHQQAAALAELAAAKQERPTGMEAVVKRDANGRMTRVLITLKT